MTYFNPEIIAGVSWIGNLPCISDLQREANGKLFEFRQKHLSIKGINFFDKKNSLPLLTSASKSIQAFRNQIFSSHKGIVLFWKVNIISPLLPNFFLYELFALLSHLFILSSLLRLCFLLCLSYFIVK